MTVRKKEFNRFNSLPSCSSIVYLYMRVPGITSWVYEQQVLLFGSSPVQRQKQKNSNCLRICTTCDC